ncbi:hypothetical protein LEP1GSC151_3579, partial [Leptospira interrogans serovar Grippotyphosa str. LT2186]
MFIKKLCQAALKTPLSTLPNQSDKNIVTWSEICISHPTYPNRNRNQLFPIVSETQSKQIELKVPQDLNLSITNTFTLLASTKSSSQSPSRPKPLTAAQLKEKRKNPAINIDFFTGLTKKILNDFYPKYC